LASLLARHRPGGTYCIIIFETNVFELARSKIYDFFGQKSPKAHSKGSIEGNDYWYKDFEWMKREWEVVWLNPGLGQDGSDNKVVEVAVAYHMKGQGMGVEVG
jgi:hypothetical protein